MVHVCDAIMGTGKSSAAIRYLNEHADQKFIYITPYLDEAARIRDGCKDLNFIEPSDKLRKYEFKKTVHTAALIKEGRNITTTHQAFKCYSTDMLEDIRRNSYTLIIDENVEVLERFEMHRDDLQIAVDSGYVKEENGEYSLAKVGYSGNMFREMFRMLQSRKLVRTEDRENTMLYWTLPPELITSFQDVFILTYLFEGQSIRNMLQIYEIPYEYIGIHRTEDGGYTFGPSPGYVPEYVMHLDSMLHIIDNERINDIGDDYHALSVSWFQRGNGIDQLKNNVWNYFNNIHREIPAGKRLWGTFKGAENCMKGKGYTKAFLTFNSKATNRYRDKTCLVYIANLFMNVCEKTFYENHGIEVDEDLYALSIMVQWIWRSAIRDGEEVYIYIPSRRMRTLLQNWIKNLSQEDNT